MIRKLIRQMLTAQILSALTVSLCLLIDSIIIGRFLGVESMAAYQLANPILLMMGALGSMLAAGVQVACSKSLGRGSQTETNSGYSSAIALTLGLSLALMFAVLIFSGPIAAVMGAGKTGTLYDQTRSYMVGFIIGVPASMGALILLPFMQMAGKNNILIAAVLGMTISDIGLDLLNVLVFRGGMFGMGLASSISYYVAMAIGCGYFLSKKCMFRFSRRLVTKKKISELFRGGVPAVFHMASGVILTFLLNKLLLGTGGSDAVAAYSVLNSIGNSASCISTGIGSVSLTMTGILFNEEDRQGLEEMMKQLSRASVVLGLAVGAVLVIFAPAFVSLFLPEAGAVRSMAILGVRLFAAGMVPYCINTALKNAYQVTGRERLTETISLVAGAVFPALAAFVLSRFLGTTGVWFYFAAGQLLMLLSLALLIRRYSGTQPWKDGAYLLLKDDLIVAKEDVLEADIHTLEDMDRAVRETEEFCLERGESRRVSMRLALCVEEMASNTLLHGFPKDNLPHHLSVRVLDKKDGWVARFRDDCGAFDPVHYIPREGKDALGIRLALTLAEETSYIYSLNLNNLTLKLPTERALQSAGAELR